MQFFVVFSHAIQFKLTKNTFAISDCNHVEIWDANSIKRIDNIMSSDFNADSEMLRLDKNHIVVIGNSISIWDIMKSACVKRLWMKVVNSVSNYLNGSCVNVIGEDNVLRTIDLEKGICVGIKDVGRFNIITCVDDHDLHL